MTDLLDEVLVVREPLARPSPGAPRVHIEWTRRPTVAPRPPARPTRRAVVVIGMLVVVMVGGMPIAPRLRVDVGGHRIAIHAQEPTVSLALRRAGVVPIDGALIAARSGHYIDRHYQRAQVLRGGIPASTGARVRDGDSLTIVNGHDAVEPVAHRIVPVAGGGLPAIEYGLWRAPRTGTTDQVVGVHSGEVLSESAVIPAVAATVVSEPAVALTFDDGPSPQWTPVVLATLRAARVKATFCIVGYAAELYPELVRAIHDEGHTLCNHTMSHVQLLGRRPAAKIAEELRDNSLAIARAAGIRPAFFRAPGGTWDVKLLDEVHRQGMRALGWNVDPADYDKPGAEMIERRILTQLRPGAVILLHDGGGDRSQTVAQLGALIARVRSLGYSFRVPEVAI